MLEMATDKETFLVPAPPPPLKPPPRGGGDGHPVVRLPRGDAPSEEEEKGAVPAGQLQQRAGPEQRRAGGGGEDGAAPSEEAEDSVAELQQRLPRNGFQPPHQKPPGGGKRRNSCNVGGGFKHPAFKRRRRVNSECDPVLPSEFLLGGNIFDPLNLNSLLDEEVNQALNAETPKSSPLPAKGRDPVEILIPKDITDPLSLNAAQDDPPVLASPAKAGRKRHRHRGAAQRAASAAEGSKAAAAAPSCQKACNGATPQPYELNTAINCRDEVVPPPLLPPPPPSGGSGDGQTSGGTPSCGGRHHHRKRRRTSSKSEGAAAAARQQQPQGSSTEAQCRGSPRCRPQQPPPPAAQQPRRHPQQRRFQYGNYCKYYGYRNPDCEDSRLRAMRPEWFQGKEVLDVGCNVGHLTLSVAKKWAPRRMVGLDIDGALVRSARQNIRHYLSEEIRQRAGGQAAEGEDGGAAGQPKKTFPAALMASRGPIAAPRVPQEGAEAAVFPDNVIFVTGNYVLERDELLEAQKPEFDVILCLSLTKWVHLNWGDEGLKRLFKRLYRHLRPGGLLLLEPQAWASYGKRKNLTETTCRNFHRIRLKPDQFPSYLTSPEVGFSSYELVATPRHASKGFQRPIYLFHKAPLRTP